MWTGLGDGVDPQDLRRQQRNDGGDDGGVVVVAEDHFPGLLDDLGAGDAHRGPEVGGFQGTDIVDAVTGHTELLSSAAPDVPTRWAGSLPHNQLSLDAFSWFNGFFSA